MSLDGACRHAGVVAALLGVLLAPGLSGCSSRQRTQDLGEVSVTHTDAERCGEEVGEQLVRRLREHAQRQGELVFAFGTFENQTRSLSRRAYQSFQHTVVRRLEREAHDNPAIRIVRAEEGVMRLYAESFRVGRGETAELMTEFRLKDSAGNELWLTQVRAMLAMEPELSQLQ